MFNYKPWPRQGRSEVSYLYAALALTAPRGELFGIRGGASALADRLADSIRQSGGKIRLDTPVLRLSYDSTGTPVGRRSSQRRDRDCFKGGYQQSDIVGHLRQAGGSESDTG